MVVKKIRAKRSIAVSVPYHVLAPDGTHEMRVWNGELQCGVPPPREVARIIGVEYGWVQRVRVLYNGHYRCMFVDEEGAFRGKFNWKASGLYANNALLVHGLTAALYGNMDIEPLIRPNDYLGCGLAIFGIALVWEGEFE